MLEIPEESSLIGASVSEDRSKIAFLYSGLVDPLMLVVVQASDYKEEVKVVTLCHNHLDFVDLKIVIFCFPLQVILPVSDTLSALIHSHPGHGEVAFLPEDNLTLLFYIRCRSSLTN